MRQEAVREYMDGDEDLAWKAAVGEIPRLLATLAPLARS